MTVRNEIKAQIVRAGYTMQELVDRLHEEYGWSDSVSNLSAKLQRESIRYKEVVELADVLGYDIYWGPRKGDAFVGRGGAAERVSFRTCAEAKDGKSMTSEEKKLLQAKHRLEEAQARDRVKERKARTRRLIQEGAVLEKVLPEVQAVGLDNLEEYLRRKLAGHD